MLLFYETYGKTSSEQDLSPCYALLAEDSVVQAVPEHPKKENVFCLSNAYGDVYLFQVGFGLIVYLFTSTLLCTSHASKPSMLLLLRLFSDS